MSLKKYIGNLFVMTRAEKNGAMVLVVILIIVMIVRFLIPYLINDNENYIQDIELKIASLEEQKDIRQNTSQSNISKVEAGKSNHTSYKEVEHKNPEIEIEYFKFDPNTVGLTEMQKLGFSNKVANTLLNFRQKGARFYSKTDILKVYGFDTVFYNKIEPYIEIKKIKQVEYQHKKITTKPKISIEINTADSALLTNLPGIGPVFARRICKFRDYLGGFVKVDQLKEVYNLKDETYQSIKDYLIIDSTQVRKININFAEINDLKRHPYCNYKIARKIVNYRSEKGSFQTITQLKEDSILLEIDYNKLSPYLAIK
ncbi:MAG: helix-hairpin-helix domain-containing protein [Prolixibacteraceae bacterium]|jgi:competence protein ComEA|nr:helix-hairpin-helix domain-containing protein [Prolixibacteraceae bacterium]